MKLYQLMNTKKISNSNKTISMVGVSLITFFLLSSIAASAFGTLKTNINLANFHDLSSFYTNKSYDGRIYVRYEINNIVTNLNRKNVVEFYQQFVNNKKITQVIIDKCLQYNIPLNIGFALAYEESRFNPYAINANNADGTIDKGLYQLNSIYHPFSDEQLFNPQFNSDRALSFLREMIDMNDNMTNALYCYNAGYGRIIIQNIVPISTELHIANILSYEDMLNIKFNEWCNTYEE